MQTTYFCKKKSNLINYRLTLKDNIKQNNKLIEIKIYLIGMDDYLVFVNKPLNIIKGNTNILVLIKIFSFSQAC